MMDKREIDMALSLYQEAIAEAKQLRDVAEQNAKNKIIDAVTPKIRRLIEKQLLGEDAPDDEGDDEMGDDDFAFLADEAGVDDVAPPEAGHDEPDGDEMMTIDLDDLSPEDAMGAGMAIGAEPEVQADMAMDAGPGPSITVDADADVNLEIGADGSVSVDTGTADLHVGASDGMPDDAGEDELLLDEPVAEALSRLLQHRKAETRKTLQMEQKLNRFERKLRRFYALMEALEGKKLSSSQRAIVRNHYTKLLREIGSLRQKAILIECGSSGRLHRRTVSILKEMKKMSRSSRRRTARGNSDLRRLLETTGLEEFDLYVEEEEELAADEEGGDELDLEDEGEEVEVDPAAAQGAVEDLIAAVGLDLEVVPAEEGEMDDEEGDEEDEEGDEEEIEFESQLYGEGDEEEDTNEADEVLEIDESLLRRELRRLKNSRNRTARRIREETSGVDEPSQTADAFGGGDVEDEAFVDVDEDTLLNALADELGDAPMPTVGAGSGSTDAMPEGRRRRARARARQSRTNESRQNRALKGKLTDYKKAVGSLRGQLTEMNLFNAKLLYANKLMQNRNLSPKQQRAIVEALDGAKTLREAKLLYKSLTNSLGRTRSRSLKEGATRRTSGSSSRSTRSASPAQNGVEVDRWAVLAGLSGKDTK